MNKEAGEWISVNCRIGLDAVIISDPAGPKSYATLTPASISASANFCDNKTFHFWKSKLTRGLSAKYPWKSWQRSVSVPILRIEAFVHGRCISSVIPFPYMAGCNRDGCSQSCRWKATIDTVGQTPVSNVPEEYSMSSRGHVYDRKYSQAWFDNGVDSEESKADEICPFTYQQCNCYKAAYWYYIEEIQKCFYAPIKDDLINELWKVTQRRLATVLQTPTKMINCLRAS